MSQKSNPSRMSSFPRSRIAWIVAVVLLAAYVLVRPTLERRWGISLPGIPLGSEQTADLDGATSDAVATDTSPATSPTESAKEGERSGADSDSIADGDSGVDDQPRLGQLTEVGNDVLVSTAGLRYTPGSREGHRLKHVLRHDEDIPDRPGKHGVFDGDEQDLLAALDEAYLLVKQGSSQVSSNREGDRVVCEIDMQRRIGFVGGRDGKRDGNPPARHIRMVLEDDRLITGFPY